MSWLRTFLIFTAALTAVTTAIFLIGQIFLGWSWTGARYVNYYDPISLIFSEFETYIALLLAMFAIFVLKREEVANSKVRKRQSTLSITMTVFGVLTLVGVALDLITASSVSFESGFGPNYNLWFSFWAQNISDAGKSALFGLTLLFAGRFLSRHPLVTQSQVEETF